MAGILILIINIVGGFAKTGMAQHSHGLVKPPTAAIPLVVGDALVASRSRALISVAAAMVISRVGKTKRTWPADR